MHKISTLAAIVIAGALMLPSEAKATDDLALSICNDIKLDNKKRLHKTLRSNRIKLKNIYSKFQCNGQSLLEFAFTESSVEVGSYIVKRMPSNELAALTPEGKPLKAWIEAKGYSDSPINKELSAKL
ncbi:DUF3718 domain-containing protein [Paraferrimonas sp. SM1919]|uniref:DUF3718 domain-containing protein n=1 Tax=Paraferrimonas sp. SM1919 TaxID=2662263 RepID=UPI0013D4323D|nr:DUF3718 domain-containing protein [Paraferrimonas sp. SM1919]